MTTGQAPLPKDWKGSTALVVVDVQQGLDDLAYWGPRNNPDCETNIAALIAAWRSHGWPVVFVRHDSTDPLSPLRPGQSGNDFKDEIEGEPDLLVVKSVHSAFEGQPRLHDWLDSEGVSGIAVCGIQTNFCCETTARQGSDLGYDVLFVLDATYTFDRLALDGITVRARDLARVTATNLNEEFATVVNTRELIG
jgi:nicotinamidase-related amidase